MTELEYNNLCDAIEKELATAKDRLVSAMGKAQRIRSVWKTTSLQSKTLAILGRVLLDAHDKIESAQSYDPPKVTGAGALLREPMEVDQVGEEEG